MFNKKWSYLLSKVNQGFGPALPNLYTFIQANKSLTHIAFVLKDMDLDLFKEQTF